MTDTVRPDVLRTGESSDFYTSERCYIKELSNREADPAVSIARATVRPGITTRWHLLHGITERYCILEGTGKVELGDLPTEKVGPGDIVFIPPGVRQRITNTGQEDLVFLAICSPRFVAQAYEEF